jgi:NitT/TauT family transport system substrate-binding protein
MRKLIDGAVGRIGLTLTLCLALAGTATAQTHITQQAGFPVPGLSGLINLLAEKLGFYKEEGLEVEVRYSTGGPQATQIVASGGADLGQVTQEPSIEGYDKGIRGKIFYTQFTRLIYTFAVPADSPIKSIADLKDKKIGVSNMGSASVIVARSSLRHFKLPIDNVFLPVGVGDSAVAALRGGQVQALSLWTSAYAGLLRTGMEFRYLYHPIVGEIGSGGFFVTDKTLAEKRDTLIKFARSQAKATEFMLENPEAALRIYWKYDAAGRPAGSEAEALKRGLEQIELNNSIYSRAKSADKRFGAADVAGIQKYIDMFHEEGAIPRSIPAKEIVTNDLIDAINDFDKAKVRSLARNWK